MITHDFRDTQAIMQPSWWTMAEVEGLLKDEEGGETVVAASMFILI